LSFAAVLLLVAIVAAISLTMRRRPGLKVQDIASRSAARQRSRAHREDGVGEALMITLSQLLTLSSILFALSVAGIFLNRKNVILLLMCVELLLLAANFNFIAFSRYLGDINGQVFVFFVLTVAAANRRSDWPFSWCCSASAAASMSKI